MEQKQNLEKEYFSIDVMQILRAIWARVWLVILVGILTAMAGFVYSAFFIDPSYSSSVLLYVNNKSANTGVGSGSITSADLSASQSLVKTYSELLNNRTTMERIINTADVNYSYKQLQRMVKAGSANGTEVMKVTVTCGDPYEAAKIANTVAEVLPARISEVIDGATMEVVDSAMPQPDKVSPSITKYTAIFALVGVFATALIIAVIAVLDDTIHDEEYILQNYNYPILAKIPNLTETGNRKYAYYKRPGSSGRR